MKLVVDSGALSKPHLNEAIRSFLAKSDDNILVLTDFALGEACNGANTKGLKRSFRTLADFPAQLQVLKSTPAICRVQPGREGLHERFHDAVETNKFRTFCHNLFTDAHGMDGKIAQKADQARMQFALLLNAGEGIQKDIVGQLEDLPADGLKKLRNENHLTEEMAHAITASVAYNTWELMREFSGFTEKPEPGDAAYSFPLRFVLANYVLGLWWGVKQGIEGVDQAKLRNDVTDMTYVAYASLYDGLITNDGKMRELFQRTSFLLPKLFGAESASILL